MNCIPAINKKKTIDGNETNFFDGPQAKKVGISSLAAIIAVLNVTSSAYPLHPPVISDGWDHNKSYFTEREREEGYYCVLQGSAIITRRRRSVSLEMAA